MTRPRTALLAHGQPAFRAGLTTALRQVHIEVVDEVASTADAIAACASRRIGVCVLDAGLPGAMAATKRITEQPHETLVVVLGCTEGEDELVAAVRAGATGFLPCHATASGLARAVDAVLGGSAAISRTGVGALVEELRANGRQRARIAGAGVSLTGREAAALELLRAGLSTRQIAEELDLSPVTVRRHLGMVARKAGLPDRKSLLLALQAG